MSDSKMLVKNNHGKMIKLLQKKIIYTNLKRKSNSCPIKLGFYNISLLLDLQKYFCTLQILCNSLSSMLYENWKDHINLWIGMFVCISYFPFHFVLVNCIISIFHLIIFFPQSVQQVHFKSSLVCTSLFSFGGHSKTISTLSSHFILWGESILFKPTEISH